MEVTTALAPPSRLAVAVLALSLIGCSAASDPRTAPAREGMKEVTADDLKPAASGLLVTVRSATADGRKVRISGIVVNRSDQEVEGVRYTVRLLSAGDPPRVLDTIYEEAADTTLAPHEDRAMRVEVENPVRASGPGRFEILADPMRIGGTPVPQPTSWK